MIVRLKKLDNEGGALCCQRSDGTVTWRRPKPSQAAFFVLHDLTHFACETVLKNLDGFYSLVSLGWDIEDFETAQNDRTIPDEAALIEFVVGNLDSERASLAVWPTSDFNLHIQTWIESNSLDMSFELEGSTLADILARRGELFSRWQNLNRGETLELVFAGQ